VVRIPSFARRSEEATRDENADGRDDRLVASDSPDTRYQVDDRTAEYRGRAVPGNPQIDERQAAAERAAAERAAAERAADRAEAERAAARNATDERYDDRNVDVAPAMPRPRASGLAMLGLVFGVAAALFVLTGTLAGYGIGLGAIALLLSLGGISATSRFHVAGRSDAMLGLLLGLGAVVVGILAVTDALPWLSPDTDRVGWLRDWLDTNIVNRF
jgi:hypothetical protein